MAATPSTAPPPGGAPTPARGRIDKRAAILAGAFAVFARKGYADAGVADIAAEAGVAKPTVYNHLTDKATLFRSALEATARAKLEERIAAVEPLYAPGDDLAATLEGVGHRLVQLHSDATSCALRRLLYAEVTRFPEALELVSAFGPHRVVHALADPLGRLTLAGRLAANEPVLAAEQLMALLIGPLEARSRMGVRPVPDEELREVAAAATATFLRAYAA
ncbi:TetR family transcriptional regulator [Streptomyces sp. 3MP-14]|uniref:TetR family transcriptional regulator n=1 Tax=Streptomyces mimosae TaxID=2586635 RepID=A0A5N6ATG8_9ACTN|nr:MULTISPECIES: TetR/AcrR family transcriptional regulator [Streptomyces]KAB8171029.1 TetR family transcriptional regulator [Streptomyces mimosae]KAB8179620.1 TetR family transcriptional regulator [Streptomyces sp. 3MP-14]